MQAAEQQKPGSAKWAPSFLDLAGVAHELQVSTRHVRRMLSGGRLPRADLNISGTGGLKGRRWRRDKLLSWLASHGPIIRGGAAG